MSSKHPNSKTVTIYRAGSILSRSQGSGIDDFFAMSKQSIGSFYDGKTSSKVGSGLTIAEEKLLMPEVVDVEPSDKDFRKRVTEFFADITTQVPHGTGVKLEIGLSMDNDKPLSENNMPIEVTDYIRYRHALKHPWVAASKEEAEGDQTKTFYIFDKQAVQNKNTKKYKQVDAAMQIYLKIKNDENIVDQMLTLLGTDPSQFTGKDKADRKEQALREYCETQSENFIAIYNKEDLEVTYVIKTMINFKVLKEVGSRIIEVENDKLIGNDEEEAIWYFKDEANSQHVASMKARMQEAIAAGPQKEVRKTVLKS